MIITLGLGQAAPGFLLLGFGIGGAGPVTLPVEFVVSWSDPIVTAAAWTDPIVSNVNW